MDTQSTDLARGRQFLARLAHEPRRKLAELLVSKVRADAALVSDISAASPLGPHVLERLNRAVTGGCACDEGTAELGKLLRYLDEELKSKTSQLERAARLLEEHPGREEGNRWRHRSQQIALLNLVDALNGDPYELLMRYRDAWALFMALGQERVDPDSDLQPILDNASDGWAGPGQCRAASYVHTIVAEGRWDRFDCLIPVIPLLSAVWKTTLLVGRADVEQQRMAVEALSVAYGRKKLSEVKFHAS